MINLCHPLLILDNQKHSKWVNFFGSSRQIYYSGSIATVEEWESFFKLPFLKTLIESDHKLGFGTIGELNAWTKDTLERSLIDQRGKFDLFGDSVYSVIFGRPIRESLEESVRKGIPESQYDELYAFIDTYYPESILRTQILRNLNRHYLESAEVSVAEKTDYLLRYFEQIGPEGILIVGKQIMDLETYREFAGRLGGKLEEYKKGTRSMDVVAGADFLTSFLSGHMALDTARDDPKSKTEMSTHVAETWFKTHFDRWMDSILSYDNSTGKFVVRERGNKLFRSINDIFSGLVDYTPAQRFLVAQKALVDTYGALASPENRKKLGETLVRSLGLKPGFIEATVRAACRVGDTDLLSFPGSRVLGPLLFRSLDARNIDLKNVGKTRIYQETEYVSMSRIVSEQNMRRISQSSTRDIVFFGGQFRNHPDSAIARLAQNSDMQYSLIGDTLGRLLREKRANHEEEEVLKISPALDAVIGGVEAGGPLGYRSLQLTRQMRRFDEATDRRLARANDRNPGLDKVFFWDNLDKLSKEDPEVAEFLTRIIEVGDYLGGGSLYTTYSALYRDESGETRKIVLKMLNPNPKAFIKRSRKLAHDVLEEVSSQKGAGDNKKYAQIGASVVDLSQEWCLKDINDKTFEEDDDAFESVIGSFNEMEGRVVFYKPERIFNSFHLKAETQAEGVTLNRLLLDKTVPEEKKREVVADLGRFFLHQLRGQPMMDETGREYREVHSDPHVGNYIVGEVGVEQIGVIDRHMYLKVENEDIALAEKIIKGGNVNDFLYSFVGRVLDLNKVRSRIDRVRITARVLAPVAKEYITQQARGREDRITLLNTLTAALSESKMEIPLELRLLIKNVGSIQELMARYRLSLA